MRANTWMVSRRIDMKGNTTIRTFKTFAECIAQAFKWYDRYGLRWGIRIQHHIPEANFWAEIRFYYMDTNDLKEDYIKYLLGDDGRSPEPRRSVGHSTE